MPRQESGEPYQRISITEAAQLHGSKDAEFKIGLREVSQAASPASITSMLDESTDI